MKLFFKSLSRILVCLFLLFAKVSFSQNSQSTYIADTTVICKMLIKMNKLIDTSPDSGLIVSKEALVLSKQLYGGPDNRFTASVYGLSAIYHYLKSNYPPAIDDLKEAVRIDEVIKNKEGMSRHLGTIGIILNEQGAYDKALTNYLEALKISEEIKSHHLAATWMGNIGIIYQNQANYPKAIDFFTRAIALAKQINNVNLEANMVGNMGIIFEDQKDYDKALKHFILSHELEVKSGNKNGISRGLDRMANIYRKKKEYAKAESYYKEALVIAEEIGDQEHICILSVNMGVLYMDLKDYSKAETFLKRAITIAQEIGSLEEMIDVEKSFSVLCERTNRSPEALEHFKKATLLRDSLINEEKNEELVRQEMNYDFAKKETLAKAEQEKKDLVAEQELKNQKQQRNYSIAGLIIFLIVAVFMYKSYRQKQKANILIGLQKAEVERQRSMLEEKNKEIIDSITYARRIQSSLLPQDKYIERSLKRMKDKV